LKAREEFEELPVDGRAGLAKKIERYLEGQSRYKDVDNLGDGIFELRHRHLNNHYRVLFMLWGPHCVALTAFYKNQQKTPKSDLDRARSRADRWRELFGKEPTQ
jgi:phage-related protein